MSRPFLSNFWQKDYGISLIQRHIWIGDKNSKNNTSRLCKKLGIPEELKKIPTKLK